MTDVSSAETGAAESPAADTRASAKSQAEFGALLCDVLPRQGCWSDEGYLWLTDHGRRRIEFTDGFIEELPLPSDTHQTILSFLHSLFRAWIRLRGGIAVFSGLRMQVREGKYREPDVVLLPRPLRPPTPRTATGWARTSWPRWSAPTPRSGIGWRNAPTTPKRAIPEYWIVDPQDETITVLTLEGGAYAEQGVHARGGAAASLLLEGFTADVSAVFDAPETGA